MIVDKTGAQLWSGLFVAILGLVFFYLWFAWESAKNVLTLEAQGAIDDFTKDRRTWQGLFFLTILTIIMSPFVEQHRWPFSYPSDPKIEQENDNLRNQLNSKNAEINQEKEYADKWRFSRAMLAQPSCKYQLYMNSSASNTWKFWVELFRAAEWEGGPPHAQPDDALPKGITLRVAGPDTVGFKCATLLQETLGHYYTNPSATVLARQQSEYLTACGNQCVQVEINY